MLVLAQGRCPRGCMLSTGGPPAAPAGLSTGAPGPSGPAGAPPPLRMSHCSSSHMTLLSSVFGWCLTCSSWALPSAQTTGCTWRRGTVLPQRPDHRGQDGAARWPVARLLLCRYRPHLPTSQLSLRCMAPESSSIVPSHGCRNPEMKPFLSWTVTCLPGDSISKFCQVAHLRKNPPTSAGRRKKT